MFVLPVTFGYSPLDLHDFGKVIGEIFDCVCCLTFDSKCIVNVFKPQLYNCIDAKMIRYAFCYFCQILVHLYIIMKFTGSEKCDVIQARYPSNREGCSLRSNKVYSRA